MSLGYTVKECIAVHRLAKCLINDGRKRHRPVTRLGPMLALGAQPNGLVLDLQTELGTPLSALQNTSILRNRE